MLLPASHTVFSLKNTHLVFEKAQNEFRVRSLWVVACFSGLGSIYPIPGCAVSKRG